MENIAHVLNHRRKQLGISQPQLAAMTKVSLPTIQRFFSDKEAKIAYGTVCKIADVLGFTLTPEQTADAPTLIKRQAQAKAYALASVVQGTSSLEAQGLTKRSLQGIEQKIFYELIAGSRRKLWSAVR